MRINLIFLAVAITGLLLQMSCNIEKRLHRPGFFVESGSNKSKSETKEQFANSKPTKLVETQSLLSNNSHSTMFHDEAVQKTVNNEKMLTAEVKKEKNAALLQKNEQQLAFKAQALKALKENNKTWTLYAAKKPSRGGKSQIVALLLCFFLGFLGVHSFYIGKKSKGIIQLVMFLVGIVTTIIIIGFLILSALGIWVLVDFIRIIIGDLGPGW